MYMSEKTDSYLASHRHNWSPNPRQSPSKAHELHQLPRKTCTTGTVSSLTRPSPVCRLHTQSKDYKPQSTRTAQSTDSLKTTPKPDQTVQEEHRMATKAKSSTAHEPKSPQVSWCKSSITINGKTHPLSTTKEYILHEYADVFKGVGTLPGGPYHIKLKDSYRLIQHPPRSVPLGMQSTYKAELDRLVKEGIITEVHEHTEWINSIVPVMKEDGSQRLCLDPKDLNKAIEGTSVVQEL